MLPKTVQGSGDAIDRTPPFRPVHLGEVHVLRERSEDESIVLRSAIPLGAYPRCLNERLCHWAGHAPGRVFLARRGRNGAWVSVTYAQALNCVRALAQSLLDRGLSDTRPLVVLSENSIEHALLAYAAMHVGIPYCPLSPAYSLISSDFRKLRTIVESLQPGMVFASDRAKYGRAIRAIASCGAQFVMIDAAVAGIDGQSFAELQQTPATAQVDSHFERVEPGTVAKVLFTSGSTGEPKGVINTQQMLCANQQQILQTFPFLGDEPPVLVDWLPWNHTFGGNHNLGMVLYNGGSLYIDDGKPTADGMAVTVANLRDIAPTVYFNVPKGFEELAAHLERDAALRRTFFARVKMLFYAGASLPEHVWNRMEQIAVQACGERIVMCTGLGCTEAAPSALFTHWVGGRAGLVGVPVPGLTLRLVPVAEKMEARYAGPNLTPGYWRSPDLTAQAFDREGFYRTGDALRFADAADANRGLLFDGRVAEDFKLSTGTWVNVGALRASLLAAFAPLIEDVVLTGLDRDWIGAILFLNVSSCRAAAGVDESTGYAALAQHALLRQKLQKMLDALGRTSTGSATRVARAVVADSPASIDAGEVTDKGALSQGIVLRSRAETVERLYAQPVPPGVLIAT
jgi:feruloyl-CoA synthase